jgi:ABC-2 type transport system permease protein
VIDLVRAIGMEVLKLRRTLALWASILVPLVVIAMTTALNLSRNIGGRFDPGAPPTVVPWDAFMLDLVLFLWCLVGLPLFVSLEAALLAGLEHRENTWKHLFALPIPRWTIYVPKLLVGFALVGLSSLVLAVGIGLEGQILLMLRPDLGLTRPIPWSVIFPRSFSFAPSVLLMLAVQTWVAIRWRSFTVAMGLGIGGTVTGIMLLRSLRTIASNPHAAQLASVFPWSLPYVVIARQATAHLRETAVLVGILGGVLIAALGCLEVVRRDVT